MKEELLPRMRQRYINCSKRAKSKLLDEFCEDWGYDRKHAIKLLGAKVGWGGKIGAKRGRPAHYGQDVLRVIEEIWRSSEQPCGKRLKAIIPLWLPYYEEEKPLDNQLRERALIDQFFKFLFLVLLRGQQR